jgi:hypothetical protein
VLRLSHGKRAWYKGPILRLKGYKANFTALYGSLNELLAQVLELAARWSPNYSSVPASSPLELFFLHLKGSTKALRLQVTKGYIKPYNQGL